MTPVMLRLIELPDAACSTCGGPVVAPETLSGIAIPPGAEFVCTRCARAYGWLGNPPRLTVLGVAYSRVDDEDEEAEGGSSAFRKS
jgi:hypothetical protein